MTIKRSGLGKNLTALLGTSTAASSVAFKSQAAINKLAISSLQPGKYQPRKDFDDAQLTELAASIRDQGLLQPIIVRELELSGSYEILAGERRWRACQLAELTEIPVLIKQVDDKTAMAIALVENLQREDLNALDQARAMYRLTTEFALTHQQIADLLHKSRTAVSNFLRLLSLNPSVRRLLENGDLDMGHARALLMLDESQQNELAQLIVAKEMSVRETEKLVNRLKNGEILQKERVEPAPFTHEYDQQISNLSQRLQTKILLKAGTNGKGRLVIHYNNQETLTTMLAILQAE